MSPNVLNLILKALDSHGEAVFSREDIAAWPAGDFEEARREGILEAAAPADEAVCPGCEQACPEDVEFINGARPKDTRAYVTCGRREDIGRVQIPLAALERWAVNRKRAEELRPPMPTPSNTARATKRPKASAKQNAMLLLAALLAHHKFDSKRPNWEPATSADLEKNLTWPQPRVSRAMKSLFGPAPMSRYRALCKEKKLSGFLKRNEDGQTEVEAFDPDSLMH
jgi:hypothetical protein